MHSLHFHVSPVASIIGLYPKNIGLQQSVAPHNPCFCSRKASEQTMIVKDGTEG